MSSAAVFTSSRYSVLGLKSCDGATMARRPSVGSRRTSIGTVGLRATASLRLVAAMARLKSTVRYDAGSTPASPVAGVDAVTDGAPSVVNAQWWRSVYVLPAGSR